MTHHPAPGRLIGAAVPTRESLRLVRGEGRFVDDVELPGMLVAHVVRSPYPHARIGGIGTEAARAAPGVIGVFTAEDLGPLAAPLPMLFDDPAIANARSHTALAVDVARYAGEPVAFVVARSRAEAEDAGELLEIDYEPRPSVGSLARAVTPGAPLVHDGIESNVAGTVRTGRGDVDQALASGDRILRLRFTMDRGASAPLETRGVVAAPDPTGGLLVWVSTQRPVKVRNAIADLLHLAPDRVRVLATDVGGGFGPKGMFLYPEELLVSWAAVRLGVPIKWIEDRLEHFGATSQLREQIHDVEVAVRDDGTIVGLRDRFVHDGGAYVPYGLSVPRYTAAVLPGTYRIPAWEAVYDVVYTNRTPTCPYRGSGGPFATFVIERTIDRIAAELGLDRIEVRRRNLIRPEEMPYDAGVPFADGRPTIHDGTPYGEMLDRVLEAMDAPGLAARRTEAATRGRVLGLAAACYTEATAPRSFEGARVMVDTSGKVWVSVGTSSQGQGHETSLAQVAAERLGVPFEAVTVTQGDTGAFGWGRGTYGSKVAVVAGNAVARAVDRVREQAITAAATMVEGAPGDFTIEDGAVRAIDGSVRIPLGDIAGRLLYAAGGPEFPDTAPGLDATAFFAAERASIGGGAHGCEIEVDPETGAASVVRYVVAADSGVTVNPGIVDGQLRGAVAQGIGGALLERLAWDENGVLANASFMDYLVPRADDLPDPQLLHADRPGHTNPLGIKGAGEAGIFPVSAVVCAALEDALGCANDDPFTESPVTPDAIRRRALRAEGAPSPTAAASGSDA